jgi:hypothetical protein
MNGISLVEKGCVSDAVVRVGIRRLLRGRLQEIGFDDCEAADRSQGSSGKNAGLARSRRFRSSPTINTTRWLPRSFSTCSARVSSTAVGSGRAG